ncbi:MAG: GNAT family N-acetyltransferase [Pseudomonadota bacterium]
MQSFNPTQFADAPAVALRNTVPLAAPCDFVVTLATERAADPAFCFLWQALVAGSASPQKIYQGPAYFKFLQETQAPGAQLELLTIQRLSDAALVGVVPVRICPQQLHFKLGPLNLHTVPVEMVNLLGSIPAVPGGSMVAGYLATQMLSLFPRAHAIFMQAVPLASAHWRDLNAIVPGGGTLATALMSPWRDCHTMPLPTSYAHYLDNFSAKKRYNLKRQLRQLAEQVGPLALERIERPAQVAGMRACLDALLGPEEMKATLSEGSYLALARQGLLLCYVLRAGDQVMAVILGTRSPDTVHVHNIFVEKKHLALSVGTSAMQLAIQDLIGLGGLSSIDFGYGSPQQEFRSSHVLETRAQVLLFDHTRSISLLFFVHRHVMALSESLVGAVKALRKAWHG